MGGQKKRRCCVGEASLTSPGMAAGGEHSTNSFVGQDASLICACAVSNVHMSQSPRPPYRPTLWYSVPVLYQLGKTLVTPQPRT